VNLFYLVIIQSFLFFGPFVNAADRCSDIFQLERNIREYESRENNIGLLNIAKGLPAFLRIAIKKSLLDQSLSIKVMTREDATKLAFPEDSVGIFISKNENRSDTKALVRSLRNHFNILEGSRNFIISVRDAGKYSKIQEELTIFHEVAHFIFFQKVKSSPNPQKTLADYIGQNDQVVEEKVSLDYVDEMIAHTLEVLVAFEMSRSNDFNVLKLISGKDYYDLNHALADLPNRIQREYGLTVNASFSTSDILGLLESIFISYSQEI
jgi:hypothetical protein